MIWRRRFLNKIGPSVNNLWGDSGSKSREETTPRSTPHTIAAFASFRGFAWDCSGKPQNQPFTIPITDVPFAHTKARRKKPRNTLYSIAVYYVRSNHLSY